MPNTRKKKRRRANAMDPGVTDVRWLQNRPNDVLGLHNRPTGVLGLHNRPDGLLDLQSRPTDYFMDLLSRSTGVLGLQNRPTDLLDLHNRPTGLLDLHNRDNDVLDLQNRENDEYDLQNRANDVCDLQNRANNVWDKHALQYRSQSLFETIVMRFKSYHPDSQARISLATGIVSGSVSGYVCVYYGKTVAICTGFTGICFTVAYGLDYVKINWPKIARHLKIGIEWLSNSSVISQNKKLAYLFGVGFAVALYLTVAVCLDYNEYIASLKRSSIVPSPSVNNTHNYTHNALPANNGRSVAVFGPMGRGQISA